MRRAFTLVEISVVLVIIGLLVGGIIAGKALILSSEIKSITNQAVAIQTAFLTFRDQYGYIPGDYPKATSLWGTDPNGCPHSNVQTPRSTTCNGDGNTTLSTYESTHAWQHLADAGLITGSFSGESTNSSGADGSYPGINIPATKRKNVGISVIYWNMDYTGIGGADSLSGNLMFIGGKDSTYIYSSKAGLSANEGYMLDRKYDDGLPLTGNIRPNLTSFTPFGGCSSTTAYNLPAGDSLDITSAANGCNMVWNWQIQ